MTLGQTAFVQLSRTLCYGYLGLHTKSPAGNCNHIVISSENSVEIRPRIAPGIRADIPFRSFTGIHLSIILGISPEFPPEIP